MASFRFRSELPQSTSPQKIDFSSRLTFVGSCFSEAIGKRLQEAKFQTLNNPFGTIFNPYSIAENIEQALSGQYQLNEASVFQHNELYHSWQHHGSFSSSNLSTLKEKAEHSFLEASENITTGNFLFITFGSAWAYALIETRKIVANCHKVNASAFRKKLIPATAIVEQYSKVLEHLHKANPTLKVIFTVSPVKHLKDGMIENNRSKAQLLSSVHELCDKFSFCSYFPAYELVVDDLRDYRFYASDLAHPNELAENYVWEFFKQCYFSKETIRALEELQAVQSLLKHRPLHPTAENKKSQQCLLLSKFDELSKRYGFDFSAELSTLQ